MLPSGNMSPEAAALRQHGAVPEAAAAHHPADAEAALAWVEEVVEAVCSKGGQLVACGRATEQQAQRAVQLAAGLVLPPTFTAFRQRKGGKRTEPGTAAMRFCKGRGGASGSSGSKKQNPPAVVAKAPTANGLAAWLAAYGQTARRE
ncbi:hypothetical protein ABPG75_010020 [Micractinium tetrahymenae]